MTLGVKTLAPARRETIAISTDSTDNGGDRVALGELARPNPDNHTHTHTHTRED